MVRTPIYKAAFFVAGAIAGWLLVSACQGQTRESAKSLYVFIAHSVMQEPSPVPTPVPPPVSDVCDNCNGRGKVGDGTVMVVCPVCGGDGKRKTQSVAGIEGWPPKDSIRIYGVHHHRLEGYDISDGPGDYRPRWTWPGDLEYHLRQSPHSIGTSAWTQDQRERYHDQWHDRFGS